MAPSEIVAKYWNDPDTFKPSRFLGDWPRDAFLPFSGGVRSCLGRRSAPILIILTSLTIMCYNIHWPRFAELESVVALTLFVSRYKIDIKDEPQFSGETFEERKERIFSTKPRLTMTFVAFPFIWILSTLNWMCLRPIRIPLVFRRRWVPNSSIIQIP